MSYTYRYGDMGELIRSDGTFIPVDPNNAAYLLFLDWHSAGNTPTPADAVINYTDEQLQRRIESRVQQILDKLAADWGYDSVDRCISYRDSTMLQEKSDADTMYAYRDTIWTAAKQLRVNIATGVIQRPATVSGFLELLPKPPFRVIVS